MSRRNPSADESCSAVVRTNCPSPGLSLAVMRVSGTVTPKLPITLPSLPKTGALMPTAPVTFGKSKANADESGDRRTVPLRLPARCLIW